MSKSKSKLRSQRRPLIDILREQTSPISPEELFRQAGFDASQADLFYRELVSLRDSLVEEKPTGAAARQWPNDASVRLQLKRSI